MWTAIPEGTAKDWLRLVANNYTQRGSARFNRKDGAYVTESAEFKLVTAEPPFEVRRLIEWGADSGHPSADAPAGCNLEGFAVVSTDSSALSAEFQEFGIDVVVQSGKAADLYAKIVGPKGTMVLGE